MSARLDKATLQVTLANSGGRTAAFTLYPFRGDLIGPTAVAVDAGGQATVTALLPLGQWQLLVQGPNRFWCELTGSATGAAARVDVLPSVTARRSGLDLTLVNEGRKDVTLTVRALAYGDRLRTVRVPARGKVAVTWPTDHGWYDVEVTAAEDAAFRRRLTGRVETGRATKTA